MPSNISNFLKSQLLLLFVVAGLVVQGQCYFHNLYRYTSEYKFDATAEIYIWKDKLIITGTSEFGNQVGGGVFLLNNCGDTVWQRVVNYANIGGEVGTSILYYSDTIAVIGYAYDSLQGKREGFIAFIDTLGNHLGRKITDAGSINEVTCNSLMGTDGIYVGGFFNEVIPDSNIFLFKTDFKGNVLWRKFFGVSNTAFSVLKDIDRTKDGGFIMGGHTNPSSTTQYLYLIKADSLGNKQWEKMYPNTYYQGAPIQTNDGRYLLVGNSHPAPDVYYGYVGRMDSAGNVLWEKRFNKANDPFVFLDSKEVNGGFCYVLGGVSDSPAVYIAKMTLDSGKVIWSKSYKYFPNTDTHDYGEKLQITETGDLVVAGYIIPRTMTTYDNDAFVLKVDSCGYLDNDSIDASFTLQQLNDSVSLINTSVHYCTVKWYFGDGDSSDAVDVNHVYTANGQYTIKLLVRAGNSIDTITQQVTVTGLSVSFNEIAVNNIKLYPNPTNELLNIELTNTQADSYSITDITGRKVLNDNILSSKQTISITNLSKGVYFLNVTHQGKVVAAGKVFKE